jgi:hypothetical protein
MGRLRSDSGSSVGYQPWGAIRWLLPLYLVVLMVFWGAQHADGVIVPVKDTMTITPVPTALRCSQAYPCFYPAAYAADIVFPVINLHQAENWRPGGHTAWAYLAVASVATGLGWVLTTLAAAAFTGIFRRD